MIPKFLYLHQLATNLQQLQVRLEFLNWKVLVQMIFQIIEEFLIGEEKIQTNETLLQAQICIRGEITISNWVVDFYFIHLLNMEVNLKIY